MIAAASPGDRERYERHKARVRADQSRMAAAGQDIGQIPPIARPAVRQAASKSLRLFLETYFKEATYLPWSDSHLIAIDRLERALSLGGLFALAMPRGSGKSVITRAAAIWAIVTGRRRFCVLIAANADKAAEELGKIKTVCETNAELIADFPEVLFPIAALERITQRQKGQTYLGEHTRITWLTKKLIFPTIPGSQACGSILTAAGLQGSDIRGQSHQTADGRVLRPDSVLVDDPQTRESAQSDLQCERREKLLQSDVLGMAGPGQKIAGVGTFTVIRQNDMADRILTPKLHPEWDSLRTKFLTTLPTNLDLWNEYAELRRNNRRDEANEMYRRRRAEMDSGAEPSWPERFEPGELSSIQSGMNIRIDKPDTFASEYQNEPLLPETEVDAPTLEGLCNRLNKRERGIVPHGMTHLVATIDIQERALYWKAIAASPDFTAAIIDYGTEPEQPTGYFSLREIQRTLAKALSAAGKQGGIEAAIAYGLECLCDRLFARSWKREDGTELKIERILIDSGDQTATVYEFCRSSKWAALLLPSKGAGITAGKAPIDKWKLDTHEKRGAGFVITSAGEKRAVRLVRYDTNHWKTFVCHRAAVAGGPGTLTVWGNDPNTHRMLQDHCNAESCVKTIAADGRTVWEWSPKPGKPDNHRLDTLVMGYVALAISGCQLKETAVTVIKKKRRVSYI